jgi:hypothetical protein
MINTIVQAIALTVKFPVLANWLPSTISDSGIPCTQKLDVFWGFLALISLALDANLRCNHEQATLTVLKHSKLKGIIINYSQIFYQDVNKLSLGLCIRILSTNQILRRSIALNAQIGGNGAYILNY